MKQILLAFSLSIVVFVAGAAPLEAEHQAGPLRSYYEHVARASKVAANAAAFGKLTSSRSNFDGRCNDDHEPRRNCVDAMCSKGGFTCNFQSDLTKVVALCKNVDGACIDDVCSQGGFSCNFQNDLTKVAELCRDSRGHCVKSACALGAFSCQFQSDLSKVIELCRDVDGSCVEATCSRGGFTCGFQSDLTQVMELCRQ